MIDALPRIREDAGALAELVRHSPRTAVPTCPGWTVAEVAAHVGHVHRRFAAALRDGRPERPHLDVAAPGEAAALPGWVLDGAGELVHALEAADPTRPVWNWTGTPEPPAWVRRRMLHETLVHRWDAESAVRGAGVAAVPQDLACDGVDEFFDVIVPHRTDPWEGEPFGVRLVQADGPRRWLVRTRAGRPGVDVQDGGEAGVEVEGGASDLMLLLWRRVPLEAVSCRGEGADLTRFVAWTRL